MIEKPCPNALMAGPLGDWLKDQAHVREDAKELSDNRLFKVCLFGIPTFAFLWILSPLPFDFMVMIGFFGAAAGYGWSQAPKSKAKKQVKHGINSAIAEAVGLHYEPDCAPGSAFTMAKHYKMLPKFDRSSFEDKWWGNVGGIDFCLHEAKLEERRGSGKHQHWVTTFQGVIMSITFRRRFQGTTMLVRDGTHKRLFGGAKDKIKIAGEHLQYCAMVDPRFEDAFDIYSNDPTEARYLVHPEYVERLIAVESSFGGQDIRTLFQGGELIIVLKAPNLFESGSIEAGEDRSRIERTIKQFGTLTDLANTLNEDYRTGEAHVMAAMMPSFGNKTAEPKKTAFSDPTQTVAAVATMGAMGALAGGVMGGVMGSPPPSPTPTPATPAPASPTPQAGGQPPLPPAAQFRRPGGFGRKGL